MRKIPLQRFIVYLTIVFIVVIAVLRCIRSVPHEKKEDSKTTAKVFNIVTFGAKGDKKSLDTEAIQQAIDAANLHGKSIVLVPPGNFLTGTIWLKSNVELHLQEGATLFGSTELSDYDKNECYALIHADGQSRIAINGKGIIDGQGRQLANNINQMVRNGLIEDPYWHNRPSEQNRPHLINFMNCCKIDISGFTLKNSACWVQSYRKCKELMIENIAVESTAYWNNNGIGIVDCHDVKILNCHINSADDGISLKSEDANDCCDNIEISNCNIRSSASAFKVGSASYGGFRNIVVNNLDIYDTYRSAIALECVDGGILEQIEITDLKARNTGNGIFLRLGHRNRDGKIGTLRNIHLNDITVEVPNNKPDTDYEMSGLPIREPHNLIPSSIVGLPGNCIQDVILENVRIIFGGGAEKTRAFISLDSLHTIDERPHDYPEFSMFGELPAWGFYIRHVAGLHLKKIRLQFEKSDFRPALVLDDVHQFTLDNLAIPMVTEEPPIVLHNVHHANLKNLNLPKNISENIRIQGGSTFIKSSNGDMLN